MSNLATLIPIRATFDKVSYGPPLCPNCGGDHIRPPHDYVLAMCYSCGWAFDYVEGDESQMVETGGWVDPANPWGSFEQDSDDDSCEPATVLLPFAEAIEFLTEFPGGVWNLRESESEQNVRTGDYKRVTAHVPTEWEELLFAACDVVDPNRWGPQY